MNTHHIISRRTYFVVFVTLIVLLGLTVAVSSLNLGFWGIVMGISIAVIKAVIILLFFMHVRYSSRLVQLFAGAAFVWLAIMIVLTLNDYISRNWLPAPGI